MRRIPKSVKIGCHTWRVLLTPFTSHKYKAKYKKSSCKNNRLRHTFMYGLTTWGDKTIRINKKLPHSVKVETLIHEIFHILLDEIKDLGELSMAQEEKLVQGMGFLVYTVLKDNPSLCKYITEES